MESAIDANGNRTSYIYDENSGSLKSVTAGDSTNSYTYENDQIKTIETPNGTVYTFLYDAYGRNTSIEVNRKNSTVALRNLVSYMYNSEFPYEFINGSANNLFQVTYGNETFFNYFYDTSGRIVNINDSYVKYDKNGNIVQRGPGGFYELGNIYYKYDLAGRVVNKTMISDFDPAIMYSLSYQYVSQKNLLEKYRFTTATEDFVTAFLYGDINKGQIAEAVYGVKLNNAMKLGYEYDGFARLNQRTLYMGNASITTSYGFKSVGDDSTSYLIDTVTENGYIYSYTYDAVGNITSYTKTNTSTNEVVDTYIYRYDSQNQLTYVGSDLTSGISYTYDANGNILTKTDHSSNRTVVYGYDDPTWADLLTSYNGQTITYDAIGNPLQYNNGTAMTFEWVFGRSLYMVNIEGTQIRYGYTQDGTRTSKMVGSDYTSYRIVDGIMYGESTSGLNGFRDIYYFYDDNNRVYGFSYNGIEYYYRYNLQGDVTGIYDANGQLVVEYKYDAWGKVLSITGSLASTIGQNNPIRYRGYYYDNETGFYYLQSRYYDPEIGRFINADSIMNAGSTVGTNMFAYCLNNPINMADSTGHLAFFVVTAIVGIVGGGIIGGVVSAKNGGNVWAGIGIGAVAGGLIGSGFGMAASSALAGSITASTGAVMAGGSALVATMGAGGLAAGAEYIANNWNGAMNQVANTIANLLSSVPQNPGVPFEPGKIGIQYGVNPNTLTPVKDLTTLDPIRMANAVKYGIDQAIRVSRLGVILDGHHRIADAIMHGRAVDVIVEIFK